MENRRPYWQIVLSLFFSLAATGLFVYFGWKLIIFLMPFVIGWAISAIAAPIVNWLEKKLKIIKKLGSALIVVAVLALIVLVIYLVVSRLTEEVVGAIRNFPEIYRQLEEGFSQIGETLSGIFDRLPEGVQSGWNSLAVNLDSYAGDMIAGLSEPTVSAAGHIAKSLPSYLIGFIVSMMSAYFFTIDRDAVLTWAKKIFPNSVVKRMTLVCDNLKYAVGGYFKAQFKIMGVVFIILFVGMMILRVHYAILIAFLISFLDFLPFFGTGTAMIPWAAYKLLIGNYKMAIVLVLIYVITQVVRQLLQPKMMGDSMGMNPLVTLFLLYIGYRFNGVIGMILAVPIGMVLINMCQAGAFDYIFDDAKLLVEGILGLRDDELGK